MKRTKNENPNNTMNWYSFILLVIIVITIEVLGDYCNRHAEEHRKESWEHFERRNEEIMHMVNWDKAIYH